ncbi:MAG: secretin N-terminal domain-containing protein [Planctomycetota bacterium]|jgi:general secretion pathway protein D|nr:secretin N-terminal domain-containing protein [Planctomycetota bacterium]
MLPTLILSFSSLLPFAALQNPQDDLSVPQGVIQDDGDYYTLDLSEVDDGGLTLRQFVKICQINTGLNFTLDESNSSTVRQKLDNKKLLLYGTKRIHKDDFYSFFQIMMKINGFVCVQQGSGELAVIVIVENIGGNNTTIKSNAPFVNQEDISDFADKPGTYIYTVVSLEYADAQELGTSLRTTLGAGSGDNSAFMALGGEQAILIQGYGPFVAAAARMVKVLDNKPDLIQPEFKKVRLFEASAEELAEILSELVTSLQAVPVTPGSNNRSRNTRNTTTSSSGIETSITAYSQDNSLLITADPELMPSILDLVAQLDTTVEDPQSNYHLYTLQYLSVGDLDEPLEKFITDTEQEEERSRSNNSNSPQRQGVVIEAHEATNSLLVMATKSKWLELRALLDTLDRRQPQVLIETALIEVSSDFSKDIGIEYANVETPTGDTQKGFVFTSVGISSGDTIGEARLPSPTAAGLTYGIFDGEDLGIPFILQAAQARNDSNILSVPSVLVANNQQASIISTDEVPYQTSNAVQGAVSADVQYATAGITLNISPSISAEKYLRLNISLEVSAFRGEATGNLPPPSVTREINTTVTLPDGATLWLGGIIRNDSTEAESGIPYLSDIPLIGWMFGSDSSTEIKTTLFFFCTPRILEDFEELGDISQKGKARAADTIGLDRVRMIDPEFELEFPADIILPNDEGEEDDSSSARLNLSSFASPSYSTSGGIKENVGPDVE